MKNQALLTFCLLLLHLHIELIWTYWKYNAKPGKRDTDDMD